MAYPKKNIIYKLTVSIKTQADIYLQLSKLEEAGFPALEAVELLKNTHLKSHKQIQQMQRFLKLGNSIADSGYKAGIFSEFDKSLLQAGEASGNILAIYKQLARYYAQKVSRLKKLKSKCYLPLITLIIALFVQPLPAFILNEISIVDYLFLSIGRLCKIGLITYVVIKLPAWLTTGKLQFLGLKSLVYSLQLKLPLVSSWIIKRQINEFFRSLGLMLAAGLPMTTALEKSVKTISNPLLSRKFDSVILSTQNGASLTDALVNISEIDYETMQLLLVGEKSGKLAKTILHQVKITQENIELKDDLLTEWIPRIFYALVTAWVATSIISGNSTIPIAL